jgi:hypothetical protein
MAVSTCCILLSVKSCQFPFTSQSLLAFVINSLLFGVLQPLVVGSQGCGRHFDQHFCVRSFSG